MRTINALGQACPMPVILTKRALKESSGEDILIQVDNEIATQNIHKMADQLQLQSQIDKINESLYEVKLSAKDTETPQTTPAGRAENKEKGYIVVLHSDRIGEGNEELGHTLMKSFLFSLTEQEVLPEKVLFYNSAAFLTAEDSPALGDLKALEEEGVEVLTCGICVDFYGLKGKVAVGEITNMYRIVELQRTYKTVTP